MQHTPPVDLEPPQPGRDGWKTISTTSIQVHVQSKSEEVFNGEARFLMAPLDDRWYLVDWYEFPASSGTWGFLKAQFLTNPPQPPQPRIRVDDWAAWSPDMTTIAYHRNASSSAGPPGVYLIQFDGTNNRRLIEGNWFEPRYLRFSPDGTRVSMTIGFEIHAIDIVTHSLRQITFTDRNADQADWSPDGGSLVYYRPFREPPADTTSLFLVDVATGEDHALLAAGRSLYGLSPRWSPQGQPIVFSSPMPGGSAFYDLFTIRSDGADLRRLTDSATDNAMATWPQWFNSGEHILYSWRLLSDATSRETRIIRENGSEDSRWLFSLDFFDVPSPDSNYLITAGPQADSVFVLFVIDLSSGSRRQLTSYEPPSSKQGLRNPGRDKQ
jgi:Tol biopolymer transport system component